MSVKFASKVIVCMSCLHWCYDFDCSVERKAACQCLM
jgi:hypothetical protein